MKERNYNRRYAKEYNWFRSLFYLSFLNIVVDNFLRIFYDYKVYGRENLPKDIPIEFRVASTFEFNVSNFTNKITLLKVNGEQVPDINSTYDIDLTNLGNINFQTDGTFFQISNIKKF